MSLIGVEGGNATRISRFANYLRNLLPSSDPVVMEMASKAMGHLSMAGDTFTAEYVEFEVKRALEWLGADRNEGRRHAAVSIIGSRKHRLPVCCVNTIGFYGLSMWCVTKSSFKQDSGINHCFLFMILVSLCQTFLNLNLTFNF